MDVDRLLATDETFAEVADLLFGTGGDDLIRHVITKANPDGADLSSSARRKKAERTQARIGLATNVVGLGAGIAATPPAFKAASEKLRSARGLAPKEAKSTKFGNLKPIKAAKKTLGNKKVAAGLALGGAGLQVANIGGDAIANRVLSRASKETPDMKGGVPTAVRASKKAKDEIHIGKSAGRLVPIAKGAETVAETTMEVEFSKFDDDKHLVFGWASVVKKDGADVIDLQGDYIGIDEIEKSAYDYVLTSRKGGHQHRRDGDAPVHVSDMVESFVVTPEKIEKMGLPEDTPLGWWAGFKVHDEDTWQRVKAGELTGFSIHGRGKRTAI